MGPPSDLEEMPQKTTRADAGFHRHTLSPQPSVKLGIKSDVIHENSFSRSTSYSVFAPSLFIGAMLGGCVGTLSQQLFPAIATDVTPFVVVGMGAFFAGVANAPIASLMVVCGLTGAYDLLPPLMIVAIVALVTSRRWSIYTIQVDNKFSTKAHLWAMNPNILRSATIGCAMKRIYGRSAVIQHDLPLTKSESFARESGKHDLLLQNDQGELSGLVSLNDLGDREEFEHLGSLVLADDLVNRRSVFLRPDDNLIRALDFFGDGDFDNLPIVESSAGRDKLLGHVSYRDIVGFYRQEHDSAETREANPDGVSPDAM